MDARSKTPLLPNDPTPGGRETPHAIDPRLPVAPLTDAHLTDAQFTDLLLGTIPPNVTAHLEACPPCAEEAVRVSGAIGSFSQQTQLWAERRAATRPALQPARQPLLSWSSRPASWSAAAAALVLAAIVGVGATIAHKTQQTASVSQPVAQSTRPQVASLSSTPQLPAASQATTSKPTVKATPDLKSDNDLLSAIEGELSADAAPPSSMYGLTVDAHVSRAKSNRRISN